MLDGVKILDFTRLLPGPLATQMLRMMGAEVVRVEHPDKTDLAATQPPFVDGKSTLFASLNEGKERLSVACDTPAGREEILRIAGQYDVLIEQFRPGVMKAWGLDYPQLREVNPRLIYISLSGYGQTGPYASLAGHDLNYLAYSGALSLIRDEQGKPVMPGIQIADIAGGSYQAVNACLAGLYHRERTGQGSYADVAMLDGLMPLLTLPASQQWGGIDPLSMNFLSGGLVNYNVYCCKDGLWVALGALELKFWNTFCALAGKPEWVRTSPFELSIHVFPKAEVEALFQTKTRAEWLEQTAGHDVCLSPVLSVTDLPDDPQQQARKNLSPVWKNVYAFSPPVKQ